MYQKGSSYETCEASDDPWSTASEELYSRRLDPWDSVNFSYNKQSTPNHVSRNKKQKEHLRPRG